MTRRNLVVVLAAAMTALLSIPMAAVQDTDTPTVLSVRQVFKEIPTPQRIVVTSNEIYVLSRQQHSIAVYDHTYRLLRRIGVLGSGPGELYNPEDLSITGDTIVVADRANDRVQRFTTAGKYVDHFAVRTPLSAVQMSPELIAVVSRSKLALIELYRPNGEVVGSVTDYPSEALTSSAFQRIAFTRGRVSATADGEMMLVLQSLLQPSIRWYDVSAGRRIKELAIDPTSESRGLLQQASRRREDAIRDGEAAVSGTLNAAIYDPRTGDLWVSPAAPVLLRYNVSAGGKPTRRRYVLEDSSGRRYGAHDLAMAANGTMFVIAGTMCLALDAPL